MRGLKDKVVIVTGGAGGIGTALCRRFSEEGTVVAVFDRNQAGAETVAAAIRQAGASATAYFVDLTNQDSVIAADPSKIWARYDEESDSLVIYLTGKPQPAVSVYTNENCYVMVDPKNHNVVGLHVENWESSFIPAHADVQSVWLQIKHNLVAVQPWSEMLRMLALWTIFVSKSENTRMPVLQPA